MRILVTGKNGQVGWELQRSLATLGEVFAFDRQQMDLERPDLIRSVIREVKPALIVNAAAYTAVDQAEQEPERAMAINGVAPGIMAEEAKNIGAAIVHYSTDYVFDGTKGTPYVEADSPHPLNVYGKTKLAGEQAIQAHAVPYLILRTSWVYGAHGKNFLLTVLRLAREREELKIVDDQIGAPTWSRSIAEATAEIIGKKTLTAEKSGIYHLTAGGYTSWFGFAQKIVELASKRSAFSLQRMLPIPSADYLAPAKRPSYSIMSNQKLNRKLGIVMPDWNVGLDSCMQAVKL